MTSPFQRASQQGASSPASETTFSTGRAWDFRVQFAGNGIDSIFQLGVLDADTGPFGSEIFAGGVKLEYTDDYTNTASSVTFVEPPFDGETVTYYGNRTTT